MRAERHLARILRHVWYKRYLMCVCRICGERAYNHAHGDMRRECDGP